MEVVVTTGAMRRAKLQSYHHHQQTNARHFTGQMPFLSSNQQCTGTEGNNYTNYITNNKTLQLVPCGESPQTAGSFMR